MSRATRILMTGIAFLFLSACNAAPTRAPVNQGSNPYAPQPGDGGMQRGDIRVVSARVRVAESYPPQVMLDLAYFQPTPCYQLRLEPSAADAQGRIDVTAYAVTEKDKACTLMALATPLHATLNLGSFPRGHYSVWVNGREEGQFDS